MTLPFHVQLPDRRRTAAFRAATWFAALAAALIVGGATPLPVVAQVPTLPPGMTRQDLENLLRQRPELVQEQLRQSGMTATEIRSALRQAGYPAGLLDSFLGETVPPGTAVTAETLDALRILGMEPVIPEGLEAVPLQTGVMFGDSLPPSRVFGLDIFRGRTTQFQPVLSGPVPESYRVGPGDVLVLVLTGDVELVHQLAVNREGFVVIPQVGQLFVNTLQMSELRGLLRQRLARSYSGITRGTTSFDVTLARLRTIQVYVVGEVTQPGAYQLASVATVLNALYAAGGLTERGNLRTIRVERQGETAAVFDLYDYLLEGGTASDIVLEQGDRIFVPIRGTRVAVAGAVERPAIYELHGGEQLADLLGMAGGFRPDARVERLTVYRILPPGERRPGPAPRAALDVSLGTPADDAGIVSIPPFPLVAGDSVAVDSVLPPERSLHVTIGGMVNQPGRFAWSPDMTLHELVLLARGPRVGADLREAEIARLPADRGQGTLAQAFRVPLDSTYLLERDSLGRYMGAAGVAFPAPGTAPRVVLEPFDHVTIFQQPEFELQRTVTVTGQVAFPGPYALERKDERLSSLMRRAGGPLGTAYVEGARFYRQPEDDQRINADLGIQRPEEAKRVNVELSAVLEEQGGREDLVLQPGDSLHVPEYSPIVQVLGAVVSPVSVQYKEGRGFDYYIANAGGFAHNADKGRVSVRYADGTARVRSRFLFFTSYPTPGPGSTIVVPTEPEGQPGTPWPVIFGGIAQVLSAVTTILLVVQRL